MSFQAVGEMTRHRRGVYGAPAITTNIQAIEEGSNSISNLFYIQTAVTRGSMGLQHIGEEKGFHYAMEIRQNYQGLNRNSSPRILSSLYTTEDRSLFEQLSCCTEIHFNAVRQFRDGKIPQLEQSMVEEYFSSLDEKNLVSNPEACD